MLYISIGAFIAVFLAAAAILRRRIWPKTYGEYGVSYAGESGGFMYVQIDAAPAGLTLFKATFDFSNVGLKIADTPMGVPVVNHGVIDYETFTSSTGAAKFGFTANGFDRFDDLLLQAPKMVTSKNLPPLAQDLFGGTLVLEYSDGQTKQATFSEQGRNGTAAIALF